MNDNPPQQDIIIKHYKKRLIYRGETELKNNNNEIINFTHSNTTDNIITNTNNNNKREDKLIINKRIKKKRKNCRSQFRHEAMEIIKLGSNFQSCLRKTKDNHTTPALISPPSETIAEINNNQQSTLNKTSVIKQINKIEKSLINYNNHHQHLPQMVPERINKTEPICTKVPVICSAPSSSSSLSKAPLPLPLKKPSEKSIIVEKIRSNGVIDLTVRPNCLEMNKDKKDEQRLPKLFLIKDLISNEKTSAPSRSPPNPPTIPSAMFSPLLTPHIKTAPQFNYNLLSTPINKYQHLNSKCILSPTDFFKNDNNNNNTSKHCNRNISKVLHVANENETRLKSIIVQSDITVNQHHKTCNNKPIINNYQSTIDHRRQSVETSSNGSNESIPSPNSNHHPPPQFHHPPQYRQHQPKHDPKIPRGKLFYIKDNNSFIRYFDDIEKKMFLRNVKNDMEEVHSDGRSELFSLPGPIHFNFKDKLTVEEYVNEMILVEKYIPEDFYLFYKFVTGYQICNHQLPVSFLTFLKIYNTNGLLDLLHRYVKGLTQRN